MSIEYRGKVADTRVERIRNSLWLGRRYEDDMNAFKPSDKTRKVNEEARKAGARIIVEGARYEPRRKTFINVNNRLEGNTLETIDGMSQQCSVVAHE